MTAQPAAGVSIAERLDVLELLASLNHRFDDGDGAGFAGCFTPDGVLESSRGSYVGRSEISEYVDRAHDRPPHLHFTTNTVIRRNKLGPGLTARSNYLYVEQAQPREITSSLAGTYLDEIVRLDDTWRIAHRTARSVQAS
jgi:SnoaL-like domain